MQQWNQAQIQEYLLQHDVKWIFNPAAASHHGGAWERCIRTVRKVMKALLKGAFWSKIPKIPKRNAKKFYGPKGHLSLSIFRI